jgi:hypothetical protein
MSEELMPLEQPDRIKAQIVPLGASAITMKKFQEDMSPHVSWGVQLPIWTFGSDSQLEHVFDPINTALNKSGTPPPRFVGGQSTVPNPLSKQGKTNGYR